MAIPTQEEMAGMSTIAKAAEWAGAGDQLKEALFAAVGATGEEHPRLLGSVSEQDFTDSTRDLKLGEEPLSLIQKGRIKFIARICRIIVGNETMPPGYASGGQVESAPGHLLQAAFQEASRIATLAKEAAMSAAEAARAQQAGQGVQLKQVVPQSSEARVPFVKAEEIKKAL